MSAARGTSSCLIGVSQSMERLRNYITKIAPTDCNVLVTGETGTGKELVAEAVHRASRRGPFPMVCVNCAAIPDSLLESELFGHERGAFTGAVARRDGWVRQADQGTLFLDEVGDLSPLAQAKILRAIESGRIEPLGGTRSVPVNVRIVAATNQDLRVAMDQKRFRMDLYFRLAVAQIRLPPLRERLEDIPSLSVHILEQLNRKHGLGLSGVKPEVVQVLQRHYWPGNVRELRNLLEVVAVERQTGLIEKSDLPYWFQPTTHVAETGPQDERSRLVFTLESTGWNKSKAASQLNCSRMTLYRKMAKYRIRRSAQGATA